MIGCTDFWVMPSNASVIQLGGMGYSEVDFNYSIEKSHKEPT